MNFYNRTMIDDKTYAKFLLFHGRIFKRVLFLNVLFYALCAALIVYGIVLGISVGSLWGIVVACTLLLIWIFLLGARTVQPVIRFRKKFKTPEPLEFHFLPNSFKVLKDGKPEEELQSLLYKNISKLYDTKTTYYMYYGKTQAYVIKKDGFASPADADAFLAAMKALPGKVYKSTI